jgi:hypothetical protein
MSLKEMIDNAIMRRESFPFLFGLIEESAREGLMRHGFTYLEARAAMESVWKAEQREREVLRERCRNVH